MSDIYVVCYTNNVNLINRFEVFDEFSTARASWEVSYRERYDVRLEFEEFTPTLEWHVYLNDAQGFRMLVGRIIRTPVHSQPTHL